MASRREGQDKMTVDDFHSLLTLARWIHVSSATVTSACGCCSSQFVVSSASPARKKQCGGSGFHRSLSVCLFSCTISQKPMQWGSPNLTGKCSAMSPGNLFIVGSEFFWLVVLLSKVMFVGKFTEIVFNAIVTGTGVGEFS